MKKYYYRIPAELAEGRKHTKAIVYGFIESLCRQKGYCWATNKFLANKMGLKNPGNISQYIQELKKYGWIDTKINKNKRKIWLLRDYSGKIIGFIQNNRSLSYEIPKESNINSNIKNNKELTNLKKRFMNNSKFP
jgi:SOS-response transcriptional repressor LexA